jgi:hypothetical protein
MNLMDFIERWLQVAPDGGNGLLEAFYVGVAVLAVGTVVFSRARTGTNALASTDQPVDSRTHSKRG